MRKGSPLGRGKVLQWILNLSCLFSNFRALGIDLANYQFPMKLDPEEA